MQIFCPSSDKQTGLTWLLKYYQDHTHEIPDIEITSSLWKGSVSFLTAYFLIAPPEAPLPSYLEKPVLEHVLPLWSNEIQTDMLCLHHLKNFLSYKPFSSWNWIPHWFLTNSTHNSLEQAILFLCYEQQNYSQPILSVEDLTFLVNTWSSDFYEKWINLFFRQLFTMIFLGTSTPTSTDILLTILQNSLHIYTHHYQKSIVLFSDTYTYIWKKYQQISVSHGRDFIVCLYHTLTPIQKHEAFVHQIFCLSSPDHILWECLHLDYFDENIVVSSWDTPHTYYTVWDWIQLAQKQKQHHLHQIPLVQSLIEHHHLSEEMTLYLNNKNEEEKGKGKKKI